MRDAKVAAQPARERILGTAFRLFYAHGPRGVGVDTIIANSGVAKATFYRYFPRKDDLVLAYLDKVDELWTGHLQSAAREKGEDPRVQLEGMFDALVSAARREGFHGCAFINTAAEYSTGSDVHDRTVQHKRRVREWVTSLATAAGAHDPRQLALQLTALIDGGLAEGVLLSDPMAAAATAQAARTLIETALTKRGPTT